MTNTFFMYPVYRFESECIVLEMLLLSQKSHKVCSQADISNFTVNFTVYLYTILPNVYGNLMITHICGTVATKGGE